jgi:hypothetical protein
MGELDVRAAVKTIMVHGPSRVMINPNEAVNSRRAREEHGVTPTVIFIRNDGWSLGANESLERAAYMMWPNEWAAYLRKPEEKARDIAEYASCSKVSAVGEL